MQWTPVVKYEHHAEPPQPERPKKLSERLAEQANQERRRANQFKGCSFVGEWPGAWHLRQASLLTEASIVAAMAEQREEHEAKKRKRKKSSRHGKND